MSFFSLVVLSSETKHNSITMNKMLALCSLKVILMFRFIFWKISSTFYPASAFAWCFAISNYLFLECFSSINFKQRSLTDTKSKQTNLRFFFQDGTMETSANFSTIDLVLFTEFLNNLLFCPKKINIHSFYAHFQ